MPDLVKIDNRMVAVAVRVGQFAAKTGMPATACPYRDDEDLEQSALRRVWLSAYLRINPPSSDRTVKAAARSRTSQHRPAQPMLFDDDPQQRVNSSSRGGDDRHR